MRNSTRKVHCEDVGLPLPRQVHGTVQPWYIWVEDPENEHMYHSELYMMRAEHVNSYDETERNQTITFTIPIFEPLPSQYYVRAVSDRWVRCNRTLGCCK